MGITELLKSGANFTIHVSAKELEDWANTLINEAAKRFAAEKEETFLSVEKAAEMLSVDRSTLWRWDKQDYLRVVKIGGKSKYKLTDVERILAGRA